MSKSFNEQLHQLSLLSALCISFASEIYSTFSFSAFSEVAAEEKTLCSHVDSLLF